MRKMPVLRRRVLNQKPKGASPKLSRRRFRIWWTQEPPWWVQDILVASLLGFILLLGQSWLDDLRSDRELKAATAAAIDADRRENLRFVRERSTSQSMEKPFHSMDLAEQNLSGLLMANADLAQANLNAADLEGADLTNSSLAAAQLREARLENAVLTNANLRDADLTGAYFRGANLAGADLTHARGLSGAYLSNFGQPGQAFDLSGAKLRETFLDNADLFFSNLSKADLTGARLSNANLTGANLSGAKLNGAWLSEADVTGVDFRDADLTGAHMSGVTGWKHLCYNSATTWPANFSPEKSKCPEP